MAVRRFMNTEQGMTNSEIDTLIHRHNMGDTAATAKISDAVSLFAEQHGKELAGIQSTSRDTVIDSKSETRFNDISQNSDRVQGNEAASMIAVTTKAQQSGIPTIVEINKDAAEIMDRSRADIDKTSSKIDQDKASTSDRKSDFQKTVNDKQRIYSAGSAPSIHETMDKIKTKLTNKFSEFFD